MKFPNILFIHSCLESNAISSLKIENYDMMRYEAATACEASLKSHGRLPAMTSMDYDYKLENMKIFRS